MLPTLPSQFHTDAITLPTRPTNIIFTGVAGTGKTHRLLNIQRAYDGELTVAFDDWRAEQARQLSWREIICAVLLSENRMMTVPEIQRHPMVMDKISKQNNDNVSQTIWGVLGQFSHPSSHTVNNTRRSANYYFDKTQSSQWHLLDEVTAQLQDLLADFLKLYTNQDHIHSTGSQKIVRTAFLSFHQAYGYDEFVEGIRPSMNEQTGHMQYRIMDGAFLRLCMKASADPTHRYAIFIDEINRANTMQVFGELMGLIEPSKRAGEALPMQVKLAYSQRPFSVPSNVDIYATMNTQDASLTALDSAFRRRFHFVECLPDPELLTIITDEGGKPVDLGKMLTAINQRLGTRFGREACLGHAYLMHINNMADLAGRMAGQVLPQIINLLSYHFPPSSVGEVLIDILYGTMTNVDDALKLSKNNGQIVDGLKAFMEYEIWNCEYVAELPINSQVFLTATPYQLTYATS